jgi:hypothetical protein
MFARSVLAELGQCNMMIEMKTDSAAAKACVERHGAQRMKHIAIRFMFLKDLVKNKMVRLRKVASTNNIADMLTKPVSQQTQSICWRVWQWLCLCHEQQGNFGRTVLVDIHIHQAVAKPPMDHYIPRPGMKCQSLHSNQAGQ